jgi:hypothetical protein
VFVARGGGSGDLPIELAADPTLRLVSSPRHATVLLAAGRFPGALGAALDRVHDQLPHPRRTVWWTADATIGRAACAHDAIAVDTPEPTAVVAALRAAHREAVSGRSEPDVGADEPPNPFDGRGDHGQGGEGMMGGVPYGRPMAMTGPDRDGLMLDRLPVLLGPFLPGLPNGLQVRALLQGSVVQHAVPEVLDLGDGPPLDDAARTPNDRVRLVHDLRWLAEALRLGGLHALSSRAAALARDGGRERDSVDSLARRVRRSGLPRAWRGVGTIDGVDARARLELRLTTPGTERPTTLALDRLGDALEGSTWDDALVTICSLDLPVADVSAARASAG